MRRAVLETAALAAVFAVQVALFGHWVVAPHAWVPPRWHDQLQYLSEGYDAALDRNARGAVRALVDAATRPAAQGIGHRLLAIAAEGPSAVSRPDALGINLGALLVLEAATFLSLRRLMPGSSAPWLAIAFLAAARFPWAGGPGSLEDFRLDWMAACGFGVVLALVAAAGAKPGRAAALAAGLAAGICVGLRFILGAYLGLGAGLLLVWLASDRDRRSGLGRWSLAALAGACVALPLLWHDRGPIRDYYWLSQLAGPEGALRAAHLGPFAALGWFVRELTLNQAGWIGSLMALGAWAVALGGGGGPRGPSWARAATASFFAAPAAVLLLHPVKDAQHLSILLAPGAWACALGWARLEPRLGLRSPWAAAAAVLVGLGASAWTAARAVPSEALNREFEGENALTDYAVYRSELAGRRDVYVAVTRTVDSLLPQAMAVAARERRRFEGRILATLPTGLAEADPRRAMEALAGSDFVVLVDRAPVLYPFDAEMERMKPQMRAWCEAHLRRVASLDEAEFAAVFYERPDLGLPPGEPPPSWDEVRRLAAAGPAGREPSAPVAFLPPRLVASTRCPFTLELRAAYGPWVCDASGLPEGLAVDPEGRRIAGTPRRAGDYQATIGLRNGAGRRQSVLRLTVGDEAWFALLRPAPGGAPALEFAAFDAGGTLDYAEFTDLTERRVLRRIEASADEKRSWSGTFALDPSRPGAHQVRCRFVRFNPKSDPSYTFVDRECSLRVGP